MRYSVCSGLALLLLMALFAPGCQGSNPVDIAPPGSSGQAAWGMPGGNAQRQGRTTVTGPITGKQVWSFYMSGDVRYPPAIAADGTLYVGMENVLAAFSADGEEQWRYDADGGIVASPHIDESGLIWIVCESKWVSEAMEYQGGGILIVNPDGTLNRRFEVADGSLDLAVFSEGMIYLVLNTRYTSDYLVCLDLEGAEQWREHIHSLEYDALFATVADLIYYKDDFILYARDIEDGSLAGTIDLGAHKASTYAVDSAGGIYVSGVTDSDDQQTCVKKLTLDDTTVWETPVDQSVHSYGQIQLGPNDVIYVTDAEYTLHALSTEGEVLWSYPMAGEVRGFAADGAVYALVSEYADNALTVIAAGGSLLRSLPDYITAGTGNGVRPSYLGQLPLLISDSGTVYELFTERTSTVTSVMGIRAIDAAGELLWSRSGTRSLINGGPVIDADGNCYACSSRTLFAAGPDGAFRWSRPSTGELQIAPVILAGDTIVTCDHFNDLHAYNLDGSLAWETSLGGYSDYQFLAADDRRVYLSSGEFFTCLNAAGDVCYQLPPGDGSYCGPAVAADGTVYLSSSSGECWAIAPNGETQWRVSLDERGYWDYPVIAGSGQILFPLQGGIAALDGGGAELWRMALVEADARSITPAVAADGTIYLLIYDDHTYTEDVGHWLYALDSGGNMLWRLELEEPAELQPLVDGAGMIYFQNHDKQLVIVSPAGSIVAGSDPDNPAFNDLSRYWEVVALAPDGKLIVGAGYELAAFRP